VQQVTQVVDILYGHGIVGEAQRRFDGAQRVGVIFERHGVLGVDRLGRVTGHEPGDSEVECDGRPERYQIEDDAAEEEMHVLSF